MNKNIITFSGNGKGVSSSYLSFQTPRLFLNGEMSLFSLPSSSSNFVDSYVWGGRKQKKSNPNEPPSRELGNLLIFSNLTLSIWVRNCARCWSNTALWQPCLFLSASLGLKGLLGVALSYSALSTSNQTFFSEGEQKKKEKGVQRTGLAEISLKVAKERELVLKSSLWSHLFCLSSCHITSCLEKEEGNNQCSRKIINSEHRRWPNDRFNQVLTC